MANPARLSCHDFPPTLFSPLLYSSPSANCAVQYLLIIDSGADKDALLNQNVHTSGGDFSFDLFDLFFPHTRRRVNADMAILIFKTLRCRFDPSVGTDLLRQKAKLGKILIDKDPSL